MVPEKSLTKKELQTLLDFINCCYTCKTESDWNRNVLVLQQLIPFDVFSLALVYVSGGALHSVESLQWFHGLEFFEEYYVNNRLYLIDPIAVEGLRQFNSRKASVQFWRDTYNDKPNNEFFSAIEQFGLRNVDGYTHIHIINDVTFVTFSCAGLSIPKKRKEKHEYLMACVLPHIAAVAQNAKIGKTSSLTDRQFSIYKLLKTSMTYQQIADAKNLSTSSIEKHFAAIKNKTGLRSKANISFGSVSFDKDN